MLFFIFVTICLFILYPSIIPILVGFPLIMGILIEWYKDRDRAKYYKKMFEEE